MVKCVREQFFINVTDILDNEGKSNPKTHGSLVKNERVNQPHHLYHLYRTRLLVSLPHHLYHLYRTTGEFASSSIPPLQNEATGEFASSSIPPLQNDW